MPKIHDLILTPQDAAKFGRQVNERLAALEKGAGYQASAFRAANRGYVAGGGGANTSGGGKLPEDGDNGYVLAKDDTTDTGYRWEQKAFAPNPGYAMTTNASAGINSVGIAGNAAGSASVAIGRLSSCTGGDSIALGSSATTSSNLGTAVGSNAYAGGAGGSFGASAAFGYSAYADAASACSIGPRSRAYQDQSTAVGASAVADAPTSIAVGYSSRTTGQYGVAVGAYASAESWDSIALGRESHAVSSGALAISGAFGYGPYSQAIGVSARTEGNYGIAIGYNAASIGEGSVALGVRAGNAAPDSVEILASSSGSWPLPLNVREQARLNVRDLHIHRKDGADPLGEFPEGEETGVILHSPNGDAWRVSVSDDGTLSVAEAPGYTNPGEPQGWTKVRPSSSTVRWNGIACSSNGERVITYASGFTNRYIYISNDYGESWSTLSAAGQADWSGITMSSDGTKILTCTTSNVHKLSVDSGATWATITLPNPSGYGPLPVSASDDFGVLVYATGGKVFKSTDLGVTWQEILSPNRVIIGASISGNGLVLFVVIANQTSYTISRDGGLTWTDEVPAAWIGGPGAITYDGTRIYAPQNNGPLRYLWYTSTSWSDLPVPSWGWGSNAPSALSVSSTGDYGVSADGTNGIYITKNGYNWHYVNGSASEDDLWWGGACVSRDGTRIYVGGPDYSETAEGGGGYIYIYTPQNPPERPAVDSDTTANLSNVLPFSWSGELEAAGGEHKFVNHFPRARSIGLVAATVSTPSTSGSIEIDIQVDGTSILDSPLEILEGGERGSAAPTVPTWATGAELTAHILTPGVGSANLTIQVYYG